MTFNPKINGDYKLHRSSGRWVQSLLEMDVAHLLHQTSTPFCSGLDDPCTVNIPSKNRRSDDFVIPVRPDFPLPEDLHLVEHRLEILGMAAVHQGDRLEKYIADKMEVHNHFESDSGVMHHLLPPPKNRGRYTEQELRKYIGQILGGTAEMVAEHNERHPPIRPGSTFDSLDAILEALRAQFPPGSEISWSAVDEFAGTQSWTVAINRFLPGQTMTRLCELLNTTSALAPYNETREQFLDRVRLIVQENDGVLPSSYSLNETQPWITVQYARHFRHWHEMTDALDLPRNRVTNTVSDEELISRLVLLAEQLGKTVITTSDLQRPKTSSREFKKLGPAIYQKLRSTVKKDDCDFNDVRSLANHLLELGLRRRNGGGTDDS